MYGSAGRLLLVSVVSLWVTGCSAVGVGSRPAGPPPTARSTDSPPEIVINSSTHQVDVVKVWTSWENGRSGMAAYTGSSGRWPPSFPDTLSAQVGQQVDIAVAHTTPPKALWIAELDEHGTVVLVTAVTPTS